MLNETLPIPVALTDHWTGVPMPKVQRVACAALALETHNPDAIGQFIGVGRSEVEEIVKCLLDNGWDTTALLEEEQLDERVNLTLNDDAYAIFTRKGVI